MLGQDIGRLSGSCDVPRRGHQPIRTCIACGNRGAKRELLRIVRNRDGTLAVDANGRLPGRGTYVCRTTNHASERGLRIRIKKALRLDAEVTDEFLAELEDRLSVGRSGD